ncbi:hypothetical protein J7T55_008706 [Diaporthe amygdali]|uniref:uncharacterized protein n=1 Tax=Phomopsis amygdali TaxID=1214568 RepID=UPI0022FF2B56|nr:uncharacterized protein J7T55_008706 [Diaporthe amygdali]KAJ0121542.1 hypothetical protein J7T55_008706 [Diaporthe amygdali]
MPIIGHRHRQLPTSVLSVPPYKPPTYGPPPDETVSVAAIDSSTALPESTSTSVCSVVRITETVTVFGTGSPASSSAGNFTSAPYGNTSVSTSSYLLTGTSVPSSVIVNVTTSAPILNITTSTLTVNVTTSTPYFPISNSTTTSGPYITDPGQHGQNETSSALPTLINATSTDNFTILPTETLAPSNFTSFPNISTPDITPTPLPTSETVSANFTSFANITTPEISVTTTEITITSPEISILPIPNTEFTSFTSFPNISSTAFFTNSSLVAPTSVEEPTSSLITITSIIIPTPTTDIDVSSTITSLVINPTQTPIDQANSTVTSGSTTQTLVIVTTLPPISSASVEPTDLPTTVIAPTNTISATDAPTGTPSPDDIHCGIRGTAIGTYYLATYAYNKVGVPVTLQGCFQFCSFAVERCFSYSFYLEPGLGAPRCKLYGGLVAYEVDSIDPFQPYTWYDVACGDPTA